MDARRRDLTEGELAILQIVQQLYGDQNQPRDVFFSGEDAVLFVRDAHGVAGLCANLSFLANLLDEGASPDAIRDDYLLATRDDRE